MAIPEQQRNEELAAIERERKAFEARQTAWLAVHRQLLPMGNGQPTPESMDQLDAAEKEWRAAQEEIDRITDEIRSGKRR